MDNLANAQILTEDEEFEKVDHEKSFLRDQGKFRNGRQKAEEKWKSIPAVLAINQFMKKRNGDGVASGKNGTQANADG